MNTFLRRIQHSGYLLPSTLLGYLWLKGYQPGVPGFSCLMRSTTGIPCPTCFLTRATCSALTGNFSESINYHVFGPFAAATLIYWAIMSIKEKKIVPANIKNIKASYIIFGLITYWIVRLAASTWWPSASFFNFPNQ